MGGAQAGEFLAGGLPAVLRLVRVDDGGGQHLAGGVDDRALHAVAEARVQAQGGALAGGCGEQDVAEVGGEDVEGSFLGGLLQAHAHVQAGGDGEFGAPAETDGVGEPAGVRHGQLETPGDHALVDGVVPGVEGEVEDALRLAAQEREDAVGGKPGEGFGEVEVVLELRALGLLALDDAGGHPARAVHLLADLADQVCVEGEAVDEDGAGALERLLPVLEALGEVRGGEFLG